VPGQRIGGPVTLFVAVLITLTLRPDRWET